MRTPHAYFAACMLLTLAPLTACNGGSSRLPESFSGPSSLASGNRTPAGTTPHGALPALGSAWTPEGTIDNLAAWHDEQGRIIQLRGHGVVVDANAYWLYGMDPNSALRIYRSASLSHWVSTPVLQSVDALMSADGCAGAQSFDQPTVVFNANTHNFVLISRAVLGNNLSRVAVATSTHAAGPFTFVRCYAPSGVAQINSVTAFVDEDGSAYAVWSSTSGNASTLSVDRLDVTYTKVSQAGVSQSTSPARPSAMFAAHGVYYLIDAKAPPMVAAASDLKLLASAAWSILSLDSTSGFGATCAHVLKLENTWLYQGERITDHSMLWLPLELAHFTTLPGTQQSGSVSMLWRDSVQVDDANGTWHDGAQVVTLAASDLQTTGTLWTETGNIIESPSTAGMAVARGVGSPQSTDGALFAAIDPGTADHFTLLYRFATADSYAAVTYDHGTWYASDSDGHITPLSYDATLQSGLFTRLAIGWHANFLSLSVDGVPVFNSAVSAALTRGAVGLQSWGNGSFRVTDLQVLAGPALTPVYATAFENGMSGLQAAGAAAWASDGQSVTGSANAAGTLIDSHAPPQSDGSVSVSVDASRSSNWGLILRYATPQDYTAVTFGAQGLGWLTSNAMGVQSGALNNQVVLPTSGTVSVTVKMIGTSLKVLVDGAAVYSGVVSGLPVHAGRPGLYLAAGGHVYATLLRTASAYASALTLDDTAYTYTSGTWYWNYEGGAFLNTYHWSNIANEGFTVNFTGSQMALLTTVAGDHGIMSVVLDGGKSIDVDLYAVDRRNFVQVYAPTQLTLATHQVHFAVSGRKNPASNGPWAIADQAIVPREVDDGDMALTYSDGWELDVSAGKAFGGTLSQTQNNGASLSFTFLGTGSTYLVLLVPMVGRSIYS